MRKKEISTQIELHVTLPIVKIILYHKTLLEYWDYRIPVYIHFIAFWMSGPRANKWINWYYCLCDNLLYCYAAHGMGPSVWLCSMLFEICYKFQWLGWMESSSINSGHQGWSWFKFDLKKSIEFDWGLLKLGCIKAWRKSGWNNWGESKLDCKSKGKIMGLRRGQRMGQMLVG